MHIAIKYLLGLLILTISCSFCYGQETFLDTFSSVSYSNNDGTQNFSSNWIEINDNNNPDSGDTRINNNQLRFRQVDNEDFIYRFVPLAGATSVTLTLDYNATARGGEDLGVYIYNTDTGNWNLIQNINLSVSGSISYNLTAAEIASNPAIIFRSTSGDWGNGDTIFIDNVQFSASYAPTIEIDDVTVDEGAGTATFTATHIGQNTFGSFTVNYVANAITAVDGTDFNAVSGTLFFTGFVGATQTITINILEDTLYELDETFEIEMISTTNGSVDITDLAVGTITDNEVVLGNTPLTLFDEFGGYMDYATTGGSMRTQDNGTDPCVITTTSANTLTSTVPAGATVEKAVLYWTNSGQMDPIVTFEGTEIDAGLVYRTTFGGGLEFHNHSADVTSIVQAIPDPSTNVFDFSGLTIDNTGAYCGSTTLGGWVLMVFYSAPGLPASTINLYQGFDANQNTTTTFGLSGFYAIGSIGSKTTILSWEGDQSLANNESLRFNTPLTGNNLLTGDGDNGPGDNPFNSTIYDNVGVPIVNDPTQYGLDLDTYNVSSFILPGETSATTEVRVGQDLVFMNAVLLKVPSNIVVGNVFEDINYGGGAGRNMIASDGVGILNATVELYDDLDTLVFTTTTNATGQYTFAGMQNGTYTARVINNTVRSTRPSGNTCATCLPVQTYKADYVASSINPDINKIGGNTPSTSDSGPGTLVGAQSTATITIANEGAVGIDFGFNFNTIVNTNETGQGSLEQFIINSNNLGNTGLDIAANSIFDPAAGDDTSIFMIPPTGDAFGRTADANFSSGYFDILSSNGNPLPIITGDNTKIDGRTQTSYSGNTNTGVLGSGGSTVGVSNIVLPDYNRPEIQVHRDNGDVFRTEGNDIGLRNISIFANDNSGIRVDDGSLSVIANIIGMDATGLTVNDLNIGIENVDGNLIANGNYVANAGNYAISVDGGVSTIILNNHLANNGIGACDDAILITGGLGVQILQNLIETSASTAIDGEASTGNIIISENSLTTSGQDGSNCSGNPQQMAIKLVGDGSEITSNKIYSNGGAGISIIGGISNLISQNSIYANGTAADALGIDLNNDGVTLNDNTDMDSGPNNLENFPVIGSAFITGNNLIVSGWTAPGTTVEVFFTDINQGTASAGDNQLGLTQDYGEGQVYIGTAVEGSASDQDGSISSYIDEDGNTDNTNKYKFILPLPPGTVLGNLVTTTGTRANSTSEFSPKAVITAYTVITNRKITFRVKTN
ncbi:beta strand repeat-containing protein [Maribacter arcticus]|uniref:beta strand repeat-containing protein n=1 Tax=Maribacter arcticus TaxID=561365 RepID=UPI0030028F4E